MKPVWKKLAWIVFTLVLSILACNLPKPESPTPFSFPTPDLTLTSVFNQDVNALPTATFPLPGTPINTPTSPVISSASPSPLPAIATDTLVPTSNPVQSSPTPVPATATTIPTQKPASFEGPGARQNTSITALYMTTEPKIDGVFEEWDLDRYPVNSLVYGGNNWSGDSDLSGNIMLAWDEGYLYIAVRVMDDLYVQNATGKNLFEGDSVELLLDGNVAKDFYLDSLDGDDYQLGISPGSAALNNFPENYLWYPRGAEGFYQKVKASATPADGGYRLEIKVPWNILGVTPARGQHYGFALSISDNDNPNKNVQQSLVSNVATRVLTDPTTWGDLVLSGTAAPSPAPTSRAGSSLAATFLTSPPVLDGSLNEWSLTQYPVNMLTYDNGKWDDAADLSGSVMLGWDQTNLYMGIRAVDKRYVQNMTGENLFLGDSLEVLLDARVADDFFDQNLNGDDFQLGISAGSPSAGTTAESYLWYPRSQAGSRPQVKVAAVPVGEGYNVEVAIPWNLFGISAAGGQHYGFVFSISDNDNPNQNAQQSMVSSTAARILTDPTTWGDLTLVQ